MGKHDKVETMFARQANESWHKERIRTLEKENERLRNKIAELNKALGHAEMVIDNDEVIAAGIKAENDDLMAEKDIYIEKLEAALVRANLREV